MRLDPATIARLIGRFEPIDYVRVTPLTFRATPLGMGYGETRFASPGRSFALIYAAENLATGIAETILRDRYEGVSAREVMLTEILAWGATRVAATRPLRMLDLRGNGCFLLGVSTDINGAKAQDEARAFSQDVYDQTDLDGILYHSRLLKTNCAAVYDRAVGANLTATPVVDLVTLAGLVPALKSLDVALIK